MFASSSTASITRRSPTRKRQKSVSVSFAAPGGRASMASASGDAIRR